VGTNHPLFLNNTYLFYKKGAQGVCVEPDSWLCKQIRQKRNRDVVLNMGVGENIGELDYYIMDVDTLNTFSKIDAEKYVCEGHIIKGVSKVKINSINRIIADNFLGHPNLLSIDIEGLDLLVLKSLDFLQYRPEIICAETLTYSRDGHEKKIQEIFDLLLEKGYFVYADTYINTIFVDKKSYADKNKKINI
jgi:FkbM family methyltransferase